MQEPKDRDSILEPEEAISQIEGILQPEVLAKFTAGQRVLLVNSLARLLFQHVDRETATLIGEAMGPYQEDHAFDEDFRDPPCFDDDEEQDFVETETPA